MVTTLFETDNSLPHLSVHRTLLKECGVLHRDMSIYNILMYPKWAKLEKRKVLEKAPPLIQDILSGHVR